MNQGPAVTEPEPDNPAPQRPDDHGPATPSGTRAAGAVDELVDYLAAQAHLRPIPAATIATCTRQWDEFATWSAAADRTAMPASTDTLAAYVTHLCARDLAPSTIGQAIAAIAARHNAHGHADDLAARTAAALLAEHPRGTERAAVCSRHTPAY